MADSYLDARIAEARRILLKLPGVVGVGYGYKARAGRTTQELSLLVYVREKKAPADLPPDQLIPAEVLGLRTDVETVPESRPEACDSTDSYGDLQGGIHISNLKAYLAGGAAGRPVSLGTLGFFGTMDNSTSKDRIVLLTNNHVVTSDGGVLNDTIYQPFIRLVGGGIQLQSERLHPIGSINNIGFQAHKAYVYDGDPADSSPPDGYWLDCATAKISTCFSSWCGTNCGTGFTIVVHGLQFGTPVSDVIEGIARVKPDHLPEGGDYKVVKVGGRTGRTVGKVKALNLPVMIGTDLRHNVIRIENVGPNCEGGTRFSNTGDSGSVYVNTERKIIGLHVGGAVDGSQSDGCHIHPVLKWLGITLLARGADAGASGAGTLVRAELDGSVTGESVARASYFREQILESERGQLYRTLVERHREEVVHLVNRSRPVTVAWHRLHGPEFLSHMLQASRQADYAVPRELAGLSRDAAFERFLATLERNGTPDLRAAIDSHREQLRTLLGESDDLATLTDHLRDDAPVADPAQVA